MQAFNPYLPECEYIPDGEPHVFDNRVYIYGSHDVFNSSRYCAGDYKVFSAPVDDLADWRDEGVIYKRRNKKNVFGFKCMWASDVVKGFNGKYYLYFCFGFKNSINVAVCNEPAGKFEYLGKVRYRNGIPYGKGKNDIMCFDPAVYMTESGEVFLYSGFSANEPLRKMLRFKGIKNVDGTGGQVVKLMSDMLTVAGEPKMLIPGYKNSEGTGFEGHEMYEASSIRKVGEKYYFVYSSRLSHELCYATSDYPDRDFKYGGTIISNGDIGFNGLKEKDARNYWGNNHGSIVNINGQWYIFYQRQTNKTEQCRQGCAERIEILPDGSIPQVEMTSCGLNGKSLDGIGWYSASIACNLYAKGGAIKCAYGFGSRHKYRNHPCITQEKDKDWKYQYIQGMRDGAVAGFKYFNIKNASKVTVKLRGDNGTFILAEEPYGEPLANINLVKDKKWHAYTLSYTVKDGVKPLFFRYEGNGKVDFLGFSIE